MQAEFAKHVIPVPRMRLTGVRPLKVGDPSTWEPWPNWQVGVALDGAATVLLFCHEEDMRYVWHAFGSAPANARPGPGSSPR
jgi:hypothetical protein